MPAPVRQAWIKPYFSSTNTKAAAHRNDVVMNKATATAAARDVSRKAVPVESLKSSIIRANIGCLVQIILPNELTAPHAPPFKSIQLVAPGRRSRGRRLRYLR